MKAVAIIINPDTIEASITFTMSIREWNYVLRGLSSTNIPAIEVQTAIHDLIGRTSRLLEYGQEDGCTPLVGIDNNDE